MTELHLLQQYSARFQLPPEKKSRLHFLERVPLPQWIQRKVRVSIMLVTAVMNKPDELLIGDEAPFHLRGESGFSKKCKLTPIE